MSRASSITITSVSKFLTWLERQKLRPNSTELYRGHPDSTYEIEPSLFRHHAHRRDEKNIFREILTLQPGEFAHDQGAFEQLVRMQHYGLRTRLLDLSFNPLVALYFACAGSKDSEKGKDGAFISFSIKSTQIKYFDSDAVSCVANLSKLTGKERDTLRRTNSKLELNNDEAGKRLLQFIRAEKPYFLAEIEPAHLSDLYIVKPRQTNRRLLAQHGAFLLFSLQTVFDENEHLSLIVSRKTIPANSKAAILEQLDRININRSSLFPEIESAASYILSKLTPIPE
jgi:hypothetical protein